MRRARSGPWPARITWAALPLLAGPSLAEALGTTSTAVGVVAAVLLWAAWAGVLVAVLVPRTASLTALRLIAPLAPAAAAWATARAGTDALDVAALGWATAALLAALAPGTGEAFVDGSSYGDERRFPLRVPVPLLLGPLPLAWLAAVGPVTAAPLLLAAQQWAAGAALAAVGVLVARPALRSLHGLARRWVVLVPAGLVLHDPVALVDPVLFPRRAIARLGPAPDPPADGALDLTANALGLVLELDLRQPLPVAPRGPGRSPAVDVVEAQRLLFTPTRPGAVLAEAARRRLPVA